MLTVVNRFGNCLVNLNAILGIGKLTVADWRVLATGESRIAERPQTISQLWIERGLLSHLMLRRVPAHGRGELAAFLCPYSFLFSIEVVQFTGILGTIVEFRLGSVDEMVIPS